MLLSSPEKALDDICKIWDINKYIKEWKQQVLISSANQSPFFLSIQVPICIYTSFSKLQLQWHSNYTATMISLEHWWKENVRSSKLNSKMLAPKYISYGFVLRVGWSVEAGGLRRKAAIRAGGTHNDIAEPTLQLLPSQLCPLSCIHAPLFPSFPADPNRGFAIHL